MPLKRGALKAIWSQCGNCLSQIVAQKIFFFFYDFRNIKLIWSYKSIQRAQHVDLTFKENDQFELIKQIWNLRWKA